MAEPEHLFQRMLVRTVMVPLLMMAALALALVLQVRQLQTAAWWVDHTDRVMGQARKTRRLLYDSATDQRGYLLSGKLSYRSTFYREADQMSREQAALEKMVEDNPSQSERARVLRSLEARWRDAAVADIALRDNGKDFHTRFAQGTSEAALDALTGAFNEFLDQEERLRTERLASAGRTGGISMGLAIGLSLLVGAVLSVFTRRQMRSLSATYLQSLAQSQASEQRFVTTLTSIGDGVIATDIEGRVTFLNLVAERLTGWKTTEAKGRDATEVFAIVDDGTRQAVESPVVRVLREGVVTGLANHTILLSKDGAEHPIEDSGAPIRDAGGRITGVVLVFRDVSEDRARERRARLAEERRAEMLALLDTLMSAAPAGLGYVDTDLKYQRVNFALAEMNGLPVDAHIGRTAAELLPDLGARLTALHRRVLASGEPIVNLEVRGKTPAMPDQERTWLASYYPIRSANGQALGVGVVSLEITERKRQEERILALNQQLRGMVEETHHRVRNNLQVIAAMVEMQQIEHGATIPTEELKRLSAHVRTLGIVHDLLMREAAQEGQAVQVSVKALLERMAEMFRQQTPQYAFHLDADDAFLATRRATGLGLIVIELVTNAMRFGKRNIGITFRADGQHAVLEVTDDGPGLPEEFDPVRSAHTGLHFVEHLARWDLSALTEYRNREDGGAKVVVTFPILTLPEVRSALP